MGASFTGLTKCTYFIATSLTAETMAPAFTLKSSMSNDLGFDSYSLNYVEYTSANTVTVGSGSLYPASADGHYPLVTYTLEASQRGNETPADFYPGHVSCTYSGAIIPS